MKHTLFILAILFLSACKDENAMSDGQVNKEVNDCNLSGGTAYLDTAHLSGSVLRVDCI